MLAALRLRPDELDARNMLGVIYAGQGKVAQALRDWRDLLRDALDYGPGTSKSCYAQQGTPISGAK